MDTTGMIITVICLLGSGVIMAAIAALIVGIVLWRRKGKRDKLATVRATGKPGQATVLSMADTRPYGDELTPWAAELEIHVPGHDSYRVTKAFELLGLHRRTVKVGSVVNVLADPTQPNNLDRLALVLPDGEILI